MSQPWGQPTPPPYPVTPPPVPGMSKRKKGCLGCGGALLGLFVFVVVLGLIVGPQKKAPVAAGAVPTASTSAQAGTIAPRSAPSPTHSSSSPTPKPSRSHSLAQGAQSGFSNCTIQFKDAVNGAGTSTFTASVLDNSGTAYSPANSDPYSVQFSMTVTDSSGTAHSVSEALGSGTRTAADNPGGSDWFTVNQGDVQVSADGTHGMVVSTVPVPLAQVQSVSGNILVMNNNDNSMATKDCVVRPG